MATGKGICMAAPPRRKSLKLRRAGGALEGESLDSWRVLGVGVDGRGRRWKGVG